MNDYTINIFEDGKINAMFVRANSNLIKLHNEIHSKEDKNLYLESLWEKDYNAFLIKEDKDHWTKIKFLDSRTLTMFQLKWS